MDAYESHHKKIQLISFQVYVPVLIVGSMYEGRGVHREQVSCTIKGIRTAYIERF
jgi:hypothetical protein